MQIEDALNMTLKEYIQRLQRRIINFNTYCGVRTWKMPMDMWIYQEILWKHRPDVVIEIGAFAGGSTLAMAHMLDNAKHGRIVAMDVRLDSNRPTHPRIQYLEGDALALYPQISAGIKPDEKVIVIEDSSHYAENTYKLLKTYGQLVKVGDYFIVEDTLVWHGLNEGPNPGPWEGVDMFLKENNDFEPDRGQESFLLTWNPRGFLKRMR